MSMWCCLSLCYIFGRVLLHSWHCMCARWPLQFPPLVARELMRCHCRILSVLASGAMIDAVVSLLFNHASWWVFIVLGQPVLQATKQQQPRSSCIGCSILGSSLVLVLQLVPVGSKVTEGAVAVISRPWLRPGQQNTDERRRCNVAACSRAWWSVTCSCVSRFETSS